MWQTFAQLLPLGLAAAVSMIPIMATILILVSDKRDQSALPYATGWVLGAAAFVTLATVAAQFLPEGRPRHRDTAVGVVEVVIGAPWSCWAWSPSSVDAPRAQGRSRAG